MTADFITLTPETLEKEHLCCIIRTKKPHPGVEAKRQWLARRLEEGHVFRKLDVKGCVFIEYAPLETLRGYCGEKGIPAHFIQVDSLEQAKALPCPFNNWAVFYGGRLQTVNQIDGPALERIMKNGRGNMRTARGA